MADPVSAVGTAAGIVSLGLQVLQGLVEYYSQWRDFDPDVNAMYASIEQLDRGFRLIREKLGAKNIMRLSSAHEVEASLQLCENGVLALKKKLEKIKMKEPLGSLRRRDVLLNGLNGQGKRLLYPFQRGTLGKLRDIVNELRDGLQPVLHAVQIDMTSLLLDEVKKSTGTFQKWRFDEEAQKILSWLSPLDFYDRYRDLLSVRHHATGSCFLEHHKFLAWRDASAGASRGLWCVGSMGTGKSVLLASVIEHLQMLPGSHKTAVAYVFCNWQDRILQTPGNLLGAIVKQITESLPEIPLAVSRYFKGYKSGKRPPSNQDLIAMFREVTKSFHRVFIIADGLDESGSVDPLSQGALMSVIEGHLKNLLHEDAANSPRINLLISSRFDQQLTDGLDGFQSITISAVPEELRTFIRSELESTFYLPAWVNPQLGQRIHRDVDLRDRVVEHCVSRAGNTFLLPRLHINLLRQQINLKQLLKAARMLSIDMSRSIRETMDRIQNQTETLRSLGIRVLFWVLKAMRPLRIDELRHALAVDLEAEITVDDDLSDEDLLHDNMAEEELIPHALIVASCAGLVSVHDRTGIVQLIHLSVAQYLEQVEGELFPHSHSVISKACLFYLSNDEFMQSDSGNENLIKRWLSGHPFLAYSLEYWGHHARLAPERDVLDQIKSLILRSDRANFLFRGLHLVLWESLNHCADRCPALFLTSYFGLIGTLKGLTGNGDAIDKSDSFGRTPLYIASALGHTGIVQLLLNSGADVSGRKPVESAEGLGSIKGLGSAWWLPPWARDDFQSHALCVAAESGHIEVAQILIENRAEVSAAGTFQDGALEGATFQGHTDVARLLLRNGALITRNTLQCSAYTGHGEILDEFLQVLKPRSDPDEISQIAAVQDLPKALYAAALTGHTLYAEKLLRYGVDPNESTLTSYRTALQGATSRGHLDMMKLLLQYGTDVNSAAECKEFYLIRKAEYFSKATPGTALHTAAFGGHIEAIGLLIEKGANVNLESGYYGTALQAAAAGGHHDALKLLLKHGAQVNPLCGFYGNALQAATSTGSKMVAQALIDAGANVNAVAGIFGGALQAAAWSGNSATVELLLEAGADLTCEGGRFGNALQAAAVGHPNIEPDPQLVLPKASTLPLEFQSYTNRQIDKLTLSNMKASQAYGSMMRKAGEFLDPDITMKGGADTLPGIESEILVTNEGEARQEILEHAHKSTQSVQAVKLLLQAGVDVNRTGGKFYTALQAACYAGHLETVRLLLEQGADINTFYDEENYEWLRCDALGRAIESGHTAIVEHLLQKGAIARASSANRKISALHRAAKQNEDIVQLLLDFGAEVDTLDCEGIPPINGAIIDHKTEIVKLLIQNGADVNRHSLEWRNPLCLSTSFGPPEMIETILQAGPTIETIQASFRSFLAGSHFYSQDQWIPQLREPLRLLLDHGADVNVGGTIVDRDAAASEINRKDFVKDPPDYAEDLNPLSIAASQFGDIVELVRMVVDAGADLERYGDNALWLAEMKGHLRIREYLVGLGIRSESDVGLIGL